MPSLPSLLLVPKERFVKLAQLRQSILGTLATKQSLLMSKEARTLNYYPPDIHVQALAAQDASLASLGLVDVRFEELKAREQAAIERGKHIRVSGKGIQVVFMVMMISGK